VHNYKERIHKSKKPPPLTKDISANITIFPEASKNIQAAFIWDWTTPGSNTCQRQVIFVSETSRLPLGPTYPLTQPVDGTLTPRVKEEGE
jgi:hypothetical protein